MTSRGSVLILSLWAMSVLTTLTVAQAGTLHSAWRLTERSQDTLEAFYLAQRGLALGITQLERDPTRSWDAPSELWGRRQEGETQQGAWTVTVWDEGGRLNVNTASPEALTRLPESSAALAATILDQRSQRPVRHLAELALLPGVTPERLQAWAPLITVVGQGPVNLNSTPAGVLDALGLPASVATAFVAWRHGPDGELGTSDDRVFHDAAEIAPAVSVLLKPEAVAAFMNLVATGHLGVRSRAFRVIAQGISANRSHTARTVTALIERQAPGTPVTLRGWHETP